MPPRSWCRVERLVCRQTNGCANPWSNRKLNPILNSTSNPVCPYSAEAVGRFSGWVYSARRQPQVSYLVESVVSPSVTTAPNGLPSPQLQQFATQLTAILNSIEQRG